jgi:hypothetical protein
MALSGSPFGNKPANLETADPSRAPQSSTPPVAAPNVPRGTKVAMPAMEIQAGAENVPRGTPEEAGALAALDSLGSGSGGSPASPGGPSQAAPAATGDQAQELGALDALDSLTKAPGGDVQGPPEAVPGTGGLATTATHLAIAQPQMVQMPNGEYGVLEKGGKIRQLTEQEKKGAHLMAEALRVGGPTIGAMAGAGLGALLPVPGSTMVGESAGSVAGGEAVDARARQLESMAGEKPHERGMLDRGVEAVAPVLGPLVGKSFAASGIKNVAEKAAEPAVAAGSEAIAKAAQERVQASNEAGIPLTAGEVNAENPAVVGKEQSVASGQSGPDEQASLVAAKAGRDQQIVNQFDQIRERVGPKVSAEEAKAVSARDAMTEIASAHEKKIGQLKSRAYVATGDAPLPEAGIELKSGVDRVIEKHALDTSMDSALTPGEQQILKFREQLGKEVGNEGGKGISLKNLDKLTQRAQSNANFGSSQRTPAERVWGEIAHETRVVRDNAIEKAFKDVGDTKSAGEISDARKFYSENIDQIRKFQSDLEQDPSLVGATRTILKRNNPKDVRDFMSLLQPEQADKVRGILFDEIAGTPDRSARTINAKQIETNLNQYDPKTLEVVFGDELPNLRKLVNVAKIADAGKIRVGAAPEESAPGKEVLKIAAATKYGFMKKLANAVLDKIGKKPTAAEVITDTAVKPLKTTSPKSSTIGSLLSTMGDRGAGEAAAAGAGAAIGSAAKEQLK